ncbi:hypothetical protein QHI69_23220 [Burkholderia gladioli pv. gladioli]|uniref:hypothetical protein n=1 Tax=Burkholderia gladioli TaxID=28095 RepID=UPI00164063A1|nr:hypothetical protein [Burkholderia gladioli]MBU9643043.1 hypothetical protein [Burkholderia gladioli]MDJ1164801.1 hypothetical protein [Burkholderia gladioli pv. gladioli]
MLSPHELATLMLIHGAPDGIDPDRAEIDTLLEHRLVSVEPHEDGVARPALTATGRSMLAAAGRIPSVAPAIRDLAPGV